jgi:hypothetical protein
VSVDLYPTSVLGLTSIDSQQVIIIAGKEANKMGFGKKNQLRYLPAWDEEEQ